MDDLRAAVDRAVAPAATTRLVTIDADDLVAADGWADHVALVAKAIMVDGTAVVDPLRLPLIEGIADTVVARDDLTVAADKRLREIWRVLCPAGIIVVVVPLPSSRSFNSLITQYFRRQRAADALAAAMFDVDTIAVVRAAMVVRAVKSDGLAPQRRRSVAAMRPASA